MAEVFIAGINSTGRANAGKYSAGNERVLIVDDEEALVTGSHKEWTFYAM